MCIIDCLSTIVFILPLYLDDTKVIILILWRRTFQLEYWRTFQLVSTTIEIDNTFHLTFTNKTKSARIVQLVTQLLNRGENAIVYCSTKASTEKYAKILIT